MSVERPPDRPPDRPDAPAAAVAGTAVAPAPAATSGRGSTVTTAPVGTPAPVRTVPLARRSMLTAATATAADICLIGGASRGAASRGAAAGRPGHRDVSGAGPSGGRARLRLTLGGRRPRERTGAAGGPAAGVSPVREG